MYMAKKLKLPVMAMAAVFMLAALFTGCGSGGRDQAKTSESTGKSSETTKAEEKKLEPVELSWYYPSGNTGDISFIEDEMNKSLKEKINATIKLHPASWDAYVQKLNVMFAASEPFDICFTAPWLGNYYENIPKGAFLPLDDLLDKYAPMLKASLTKDMWNAARVSGKIYGAINQQIFTNTGGYYIQKRIVDKYGIDVSKMHKLADFEPILKAVKENEKGMQGIQISNGGLNWYDGQTTMGNEWISPGPGTILIDDPSLKVVDGFDLQYNRDYYKLIRDWYLKGYFKKDIATVTDTTAEYSAGKFAIIPATYKPGGDVEISAAIGGLEVVEIQTSKPYLTTMGIISTMTAVSKTSKNPERAMMFVELMNNNKKLYNTMAFGIEGKNYKKISDDTIELVPNSGYSGDAWMYGNQFNAFYTKGQKPGIWEETRKLNQEAIPSPVLGFTFDPAPVKNEIAQCSAVDAEYSPLLNTGSVDPDKVLPEYIDKLKKAGMDKVIVEKQRQLDEWRKANNR